jgi:hypothetical protein
MVDSTELEHIRTFLGKVHTAATVKHENEIGKESKILDTQRIFVETGELINVEQQFYIKRYKITLSETSEANLMTALNNIVIGLDKLNTRQTISEYTKPAILCNGYVAYGNKAHVTKNNNRWRMEVFLDFRWSVA